MSAMAYDLFNFSHMGYNLSSGGETNFLINAERLTSFDLKALAKLVSSRITYGAVEGVPRGGLPFAMALRSYRTYGHPRTLIVDDVYTTGRSMREQAGDRLKAIYYHEGSVIPYDPQATREWKIDNATIPADMPHLVGIVIFARSALVDPWVKPIFRTGWGDL